MGDLREDLASSMAEQQQEEHSQETENSNAASEMGNTQVNEQTNEQQEYEIGGRKFNSWADVKKWGDNFVSQRGRETNELRAARERLAELEKGEAAQWMNDLKQHPNLANKIRNAYKEYNEELQSGATKKEAAAASGVNKLPPEVQDLIKWKQTVVEEIQKEQVNEAIDKQLEELKTSVPDIDKETLAAVYDFASEHTSLTLMQAYNVIVAQINAEKAASVKDTGNSGKFATVKTPSKRPDLTNEKAAKNNIAALLKGE